MKDNFLPVSLIIFYSFCINWYSANIGILPIDTFGFFDPGFVILKGQIPIRDFWAYTGITVDYLQSLFFLLFGNNWNSYISHSSSINVLASLIFYFFLLEIKISRLNSLIYTLSFATLLYPVVGTPFAYLHAYVFSLMGIIVFAFSYHSKKYKLWIIIPVIFLISFLSMQTPTIYLIATLIPFIIFFTLKDKNTFMFNQLVIGTFISLALLVLYLLISKTNFKDFVYQYLLFPMTIAEGRMTSEAVAYVKLTDQLNFKRIFGEFKFIHIFLIPLVLILIIKFKEKKIDKIFYLSLIFILGSILLIYNQLLQANQIYIFSLIPLLAALLEKNSSFFKKKIFNKISFFIILGILLITFKFHLRYNVDRKFIELENIEKSNSILASEIHKNFRNLKWISHLTEPEEDKIFLKSVLNELKDENENSYVLSHYQFSSTLLNKNFYLLNRWYLWDNNSHPVENHKYFEYYKSFATDNFEKKNIKNIYLISEKEEMKFKNIKEYFIGKCFDEKELIKKRFIKLTLKKCI